MVRSRRLLLLSAALLVVPLFMGPAQAADMADRFNDFPTKARADYIFACMAANGQTREMLDKCSCSIDAIAEILSYDDYVKAETVLSMQQGSGERLSMFKTMAAATEPVKVLRRAQAEAEMRCFE